VASQFLLNIFIAFLWVLLRDEDVLRIETVISGFIIGAIIVFLMRRFYGGDYYLYRVLKLLQLILLFITETFKSSVVVIKHILSPKINLEPGIFTYKTSLKGDWQITTLALLLTLTPGSVVMEVNEEGNVFYIHAMDINRYKGDLENWLVKFEKAIRGVTGE